MLDVRSEALITKDLYYSGVAIVQQCAAIVRLGRGLLEVFEAALTGVHFEASHVHARGGAR